jgi:hypothetical protein
VGADVLVGLGLHGEQSTTRVGACGITAACRLLAGGKGHERAALMCWARFPHPMGMLCICAIIFEWLLRRCCMLMAYVACVYLCVTSVHA